MKKQKETKKETNKQRKKERNKPTFIFIVTKITTPEFKPIFLYSRCVIN